MHHSCGCGASFRWNISGSSHLGLDWNYVKYRAEHISKILNTINKKKKGGSSHE